MHARTPVLRHTRRHTHTLAHTPARENIMIIRVRDFDIFVDIKCATVSSVCGQLVGPVTQMPPFLDRTSTVRVESKDMKEGVEGRI